MGRGQEVLGSHLQRHPRDDVQGVDDVPQGFAHLAPVGVADNGVEVHLGGRGQVTPGDR